MTKPVATLAPRRRRPSVASVLTMSIALSGCARAPSLSPIASPSLVAHSEREISTRQGHACGGRGVVVLKDGERVEGTLIEREPGKVVTIETATGQRRTFAWSLVREVLGSVQPADVKPAPLDEPEERPKPARERPAEAIRKGPSVADSDMVTIRFESVDGPKDRIEIKTGEQSCSTPCSLVLKRGSHEVKMGSFSKTIEFSSSGTVKAQQQPTGAAAIEIISAIGVGLGVGMTAYALEKDSNKTGSAGVAILLLSGAIFIPVKLATSDSLDYKPATGHALLPSRLTVGVALTPERGLLAAGLSF